MIDMFEREVVAVKELADQIGYGHMMEIAAALWAIQLEDNKIPIDGAFVPTISVFICDEAMKEEAEKSRKIYMDMIRECGIDL